MFACQKKTSGRAASYVEENHVGCSPRKGTYTGGVAFPVTKRTFQCRGQGAARLHALSIVFFIELLKVCPSPFSHHKVSMLRRHIQQHRG